MTAKPPNMTTDADISVASHEYSLTVGPADPNLLRALGTCSFPIRSRSGCSLRSRPYRKLGAYSHGEAVQFGICGCVCRMAQEFGDHSDTDARRMRWARQPVAQRSAAQRQEAGHERDE
jgi:hypothetical protein